jgi:hypothetical protein
MKKITRRTVITTLGAAGIGTCIYGLTGCATFTKVGTTPPIASGAYTVKEKSLRLFLDKIPELAAAGGSVKIIDAQLPMPLLVARTGENTYSVVSLLCPHRNVEIEYQHQEKYFRCASLGHSKFGLDGKVIKSMTTKESISHYPAALDPADKNCLVVPL